MGLDMYLTGEVFFTYDHPNRTKKPHAIKQTEYDLGYWRKHPNLHGYIVDNFADGEDKCQRIDLTEEQLEQLIKACEGDGSDFKTTTGFFFGASDDTPEERAQDAKIFKDALKWLRKGQKGVWKSVAYQASW